MSAEALSIWLCETQLPREGISVGLAHVLTRLPPERFLEYADEIQAGCVRFQESPFWMGIIDRARDSAPSWAAGLAEQLRPGTLFGARSEAPVQIAESFVADDERVRRLLEDGARGYFGGSPEQRFRAGLIVVVNPRPGEGSTEFLGSLLDSPLTTADGQMGCLLAQFLPGSGVADRSESAALLLRTLQDERFSHHASHQLVKTFDESGPSGIDAAQWQLILRTARGIVGERDE